MNFLCKKKKKKNLQHNITQHTHTKKQNRKQTSSCLGRQRPVHSSFLVFLFGLLPSLLCLLSKHHSFLLLDPTLGCGLRGLAPSHSSSTPLKTLLCTVLCLQLKAEGLGLCGVLLVDMQQPHLFAVHLAMSFCVCCFMRLGRSTMQYSQVKSRCEQKYVSVFYSNSVTAGEIGNSAGVADGLCLARSKEIPMQMRNSMIHYKKHLEE